MNREGAQGIEATPTIPNPPLNISFKKDNMRFPILIISFISIFCISTSAQVIKEMPDLPPIPMPSDGSDPHAGKDPGMINSPIPPGFPGGTDSLVVYLKRHIKLPILKPNNNKLFCLIVGIKIDSCGNFTEVQTYWAPENEWPEMEELIKAAIKQMPRWIPRMSYDRKEQLKSIESFVFYAQNNHLVFEGDRKYFQIF